MTRLTDCALNRGFSLPGSLDAEIVQVWEETADLSLAQAFERFTADLAIVPHPWAKRYPTLAEGVLLDASSGLRLALLALAELPTRDQRSYEGRIELRPTHRAYALLADGFRAPERIAPLPRDLRWLIVDAIVDGAYLDDRVNSMQEATGWVSSAARIDHRSGEDIDAVLPRMWRLAEDGFTADGYNDGGYEFTFDDIAELVRDPLEAAELRLAHGLLDYASTPWESRSQILLRTALERAQGLGVDIHGLCAASTPIIGSYSTEALPRSLDELARALAQFQRDNAAQP